MMTLYQRFEFGYPNGELFYDRAGALTRRLREAFPSTFHGKEMTMHQRELYDEDFTLVFGAAYSTITTMDSKATAFDDAVKSFVAIVTEVLEMTELSRFAYRHVVGHACSSEQEACDLMWPLIGGNLRETLAADSPSAKWTTFQGEFSQGNLQGETRVAVLNIKSHDNLPVDSLRSPADADPFAPLASETVRPHITAHIQLTGTDPVSVADFDVVAFVQNIRDSHSAEIAKKLASNLTEK